MYLLIKYMISLASTTARAIIKRAIRIELSEKTAASIVGIISMIDNFKPRISNMEPIHYIKHSK